MAERVAGPEIERLIHLLARLPGLGRARRGGPHCISSASAKSFLRRCQARSTQPMKKS